MQWPQRDNPRPKAPGRPAATSILLAAVCARSRGKYLTSACRGPHVVREPSQNTGRLFSLYFAGGCQLAGM